MSDIAIDASLTLQWFLEGEADRGYSLKVLQRALVQTFAELPMMNRCHNSYLRKYCSRAGTLTRRL